MTRAPKFKHKFAIKHFPGQHFDINHENDRVWSAKTATPKMPIIFNKNVVSV